MANVYAKKQIVITKGKGAILWDVNGNEYIDCMSNYGVSLVGHSHPKVIKTIKEQSELLISCHGSLYNEARSIFLERLVNVMPKGLDKIFLSNSGTEAIECSIKLARKFTGKHEIIAMIGGYHGKTFGSLSATWSKKYRTSFEPLVPGFQHVSYGNSDKIRDSINEKTAILLYDNGIKTIEELKKTSIKDLIKIDGINKKIVKKIFKELNKNKNKESSEMLEAGGKNDVIE